MSGGGSGGKLRRVRLVGRGPIDRLRDALAELDPTLVLESGDGAPPEAIVHWPATPFGRRLPDLDEAVELLRACPEEVRSYVLISSTIVYSPDPSHPGMRGETAAERLRPSHPWASRYLEIERRAGEILAEREGVVLTVLRPAPMPRPGGEDFWSRLLLGRGPAGTLLGHHPPLQLTSEAALFAAVAAALEKRPGGVVHVAPEAVVPLDRALRLAGRFRLPLPYWLQWLGRRLLAPLGLAFPAPVLAYVRYSTTVSPARAERELGLDAGPSSAAAVRALRPPSGRGGVEPEGEDFDPFGLDRAFIDRLSRSLFRFLFDRYWRVESQGLEHVPKQGPVVLAGVHRGFMPFDAFMLLHLMATRLDRYPRFLIHPALAKFPFLHDLIHRAGGLVACQENADWVLERDGVLGVFPEGVKGAFSRYRDAYRLGKVRDDFVRMALRHRAPIVPVVTVGSAEVYPMLAHIDWSWWKRTTGWPCFPIVATPIPLPAKFHIRFLPPIDPAAEHGPEAAEDRALVRRISAGVKEQLQASLTEMRERRPSVFYGSVFDEADPTQGIGGASS